MFTKKDGTSKFDIFQNFSRPRKQMHECAQKFRWWYVVGCCMGQYIHFREYRFMSFRRLCTLTTDTTCELNVLGHNGHTLGVNGAQVGVFKETDQVSLRCFLKNEFYCLVWVSFRAYERSPYFKAQRSYSKIEVIFTWRAPMAWDWKRKSVLKSWAISRTNRWNGSLRINNSVDFW